MKAVCVCVCVCDIDHLVRVFGQSGGHIRGQTRGHCWPLSSEQMSTCTSFLSFDSQKMSSTYKKCIPAECQDGGKWVWGSRPTALDVMRGTHPSPHVLHSRQRLQAGDWPAVCSLWCSSCAGWDDLSDGPALVCWPAGPHWPVVYWSGQCRYWRVSWPVLALLVRRYSQQHSDQHWPPANDRPPTGGNTASYWPQPMVLTTLTQLSPVLTLRASQWVFCNTMSTFFLTFFPAFRFNSDQGGICFHADSEYICQKSPFGNLNIYGRRFFTERSFVIVKAFIYLEI